MDFETKQLFLTNFGRLDVILLKFGTKYRLFVAKHPNPGALNPNPGALV